MIKNNTIIPPKLSPGDTIAVFSPSAPATATARKRYERGRHYLESKGFHIFEGILTGKQDFYRSGSIRQRADELNQLIRNPDIKCIMSAIGGMNSNSLLPYVDYEALKAHPKIIIGYSDVTALLLGIYAKTGLTTYYGPAVVASFGEFPPFVDDTFRYFSDILVQGLSLPHPFSKPEFWTDEFIDWNIQEHSKTGTPNQWITVQPGKVSGRVIGGNLNTMQGIWGTEYMPQINSGDILFIEDSLKDAGTLERSFALMKVSGIFDHIGGLILGKHEKFDDLGTGRKPYEILQEVMGDAYFPILADFDCCHTHPMLTLPIGAEIQLDAGKQSVTLMHETYPGHDVHNHNFKEETYGNKQLERFI